MRDSAPRGVWSGLLLLACVVVLSVVTEELPLGLLPQMADDLAVSPSAVGLLVTAFAITVAVTCVPIVRLTRTSDRRMLLAIAVLGLGASAVASAVVPGYAAVAVTRVVGGLAHGLFWSVVGAYVGHVLPPRQTARGVAVVLGGSTVGFVAGVPLATLMGQAWGWRTAFLVVGVALCVAALVLARALSPAPGSGTSAVRRDPTVLPTLLLCAATLLVMSGHFAFYTYIAPYLVDVGGLPAGAVAGGLLVCGGAGAVGLVLAARFGTRIALGAALSLGASALCVVLLIGVAGHPEASLVAVGLWSAAFGMLPALLQNAVLIVVSPGFRDLGSAIYTAAFNIGIGGGAALGAAVYAGAGIAAVPVPYLGVLVLAAAVATGLAIRGRASRVPPPRPDGAG